jgi:hypothetical protein
MTNDHAAMTNDLNLGYSVNVMGVLTRVQGVMHAWGRFFCGAILDLSS